jgi:hypothetical protein
VRLNQKRKLEGTLKRLIFLVKATMNPPFPSPSILNFPFIEKKNPIIGSFFIQLYGSISTDGIAIE